MEPIEIASPEDLQKAIEIDDYAIGALAIIYSYQTADEKIIGTTNQQNGQGFNGTDAPFCTSLMEQYNSRGRLTEKQITALRRLLPKYHGQIQSITPLPNKVAPIATEKAPQKNEAKLVDKNIVLTFAFDMDLITSIKLITRRRWDSVSRAWKIPLNVDAVDQVLNLGFELSSPLKKWYEEQTKPVTASDIAVTGMKANLYGYQQEGVAFIDSRKGRAMIADEMGLGKTIQALAWMQLRKDIALPAIVICPASLKLNWAREALKFTEDLKPVLVSGTTKKKFEGRGNLYIANYDIIHESTKCPVCNGQKKDKGGNKCKKCKGKGKLIKLDNQLADLNFKTVVYDECHYTKSQTAGRTLAAIELAKQAEHVITLSGTPIVNRPVEFYNSIHMTNPAVVQGFWQFTQRYCGRRHNGFGWEYNGATNIEELHEKLTRTVMLRRLKKDVLKELPAKIRTVVPLEIDHNKYQRAIETIQAELEAADNQAQHLSIIEKAKQWVVVEKMKEVKEWISDYIENGKKIVVFADHRKVVEEIAEHFGKAAVMVYGGVSPEAKQKSVDRFQKDDSCRIFVGSKAAKEGLTLTASDATCFVELWWTSGDHDQAEDRVHRIGQEAESVTAYYLLAAGTIEEDIAEMLDSKRNVVSQALDGKEVEDISMLTKLMDKILNLEE